MTPDPLLRSVGADHGEAIPVIDLTSFREGGAGAAEVVAAVERACRSIGFFLVTGHGVADTVVDDLYVRARAIFDLPEAEKRALADGAREAGGVDYAPLLKEALGATLGAETPGDIPGDIKESLNYGPRLPGTPWPAAGLAEAFKAYFAAMEGLSHTLRRIFCRAIGLEEDHFEPAFEGHLSALRVISYPDLAEAPRPGQLRAGVHTDYGFLTILRSEASPGGLEVRRRSGEWVPVPAVERAFVVNIADAFMRWTNDAWVSTPHRVANPPAARNDPGRSDARRQSIAFFLNPSAETVIRCLEPYCTEATPARYEPVTYGDYIALKTSQAFRGSRQG